MSTQQGLFRRKSDLVVREIAGEVFLVPIRGELAKLSRLFVLNGVGAFLWHRLEQERSAESLVEELLTTYEVGREEAESDVDDFLASMEGAALIERRESSAEAGPG